jgi:hypothetical protein
MKTDLNYKIETKHIKLVDGEFTPSQALDILSALIDEKINYHKVENLQHWESNHHTDPQPFLKRIQELEHQKQVLEDYVLKLKKAGQNLKINGKLSLKPVD